MLTLNFQLGFAAGAALLLLEELLPPHVHLVERALARSSLALAFAAIVAVAAYHGLAGRPATAAPAAFLAIAAATIRGLDGYCTPLFYREIFAQSRSVDVLRWAGILAIWVVNAGVWATLVAVAAQNARR